MWLIFERHVVTSASFFIELLRVIGKQLAITQKLLLAYLKQNERFNFYTGQIKLGHNGVMTDNKTWSKTGKTQRNDTSDVHQPPAVIIQKSNAAF